MANSIAANYPRVSELRGTEGISENDLYYFGYQYGLGKEHIVPYFKAHNVPMASAKVCEIGCGEGGVLAAVGDEGTSELLGIDIRTEAIERAEKFFKALKLTSEFTLHDVTGSETPVMWRGKYDLVILRDVIEHLDETVKSLKHTMDFLRPGGYLYVVFPPYYSPYGAHQHVLHNLWGKLPFIQFLPNAIFKMLIKSGYYLDVEEVSRLRDIRLTITKFREASEAAGFAMIDEELFFLRPVFKLKFGINPIKVNLLRKIPYLREVFALEASYLLRKPE